MLPCQGSFSHASPCDSTALKPILETCALPTGTLNDCTPRSLFILYTAYSYPCFVRESRTVFCATTSWPSFGAPSCTEKSAKGHTRIAGTSRTVGRGARCTFENTKFPDASCVTRTSRCDTLLFPLPAAASSAAI